MIILSSLLASNYPLISVIIPFHNDFASLEGAVQSILAQDYGNFQIILVDDFSTEQNNVVIPEDARIRMVKLSKHRNLLYARAAGLKAAEGDLVIFLDADDTLTPWALRESYNAYQMYGNPTIVHLAENRTGVVNGKRIMESYLWASPLPGKRDPEELLDGVLDQGNRSTMHGKMWRRDFLRSVFDEVGVETLLSGIFFSEDLLINAIAFYMAESYVGVPEHVGYIYSMGPQQITTQSKTNLTLARKRQADNLVVFDRLLEVFPAGYRRRLERMIYESMVYHLTLLQQTLTPEEMWEFVHTYASSELIGIRARKALTEEFGGQSFVKQPGI